MSDVVLYNVPPSLCSQKVRLALVEKGVSFTNRWVDIGPTAENYEPWYVKLNPKCVVPTLTHGDKVVTDLAVIMRYVAEEFDGAALLPEEPDVRERMEHWYSLGADIDFRLFTFSNAKPKIVQIMLGKKIKKLKKYAEKYPDLRELYAQKLKDIQGLQAEVVQPERLKEMNQRLEESLNEMDALLAEQPFLSGQAYTLADVIWTVTLTRIQFIKRFEVIEGRPNVLAYYRRMQSRPSYLAADLWPRFKVGSMMPVFVKVLAPRLAVLGLLLLGVVAIVYLLWWLSPVG